MTRISFFLLAILFPFLTQAQATYCTAKDKDLCNKHLESLAKVEGLEEQSMGDIAITVGQRFMGLPYVAKTLDIPGEEKLVVNLQGLDCTTFLENVVVFSRLVKMGTLNFDDFQRELSHLRYRDGEQGAYPTRLHYFSEWIHDNTEKGLVQNMSEEIGGVPFKKTIDFMSNHRDAYAQLSNDDFYAAIQQTEADLKAKPLLHYVPQETIARHEKGIKSGDLIALTTNIKGLDIAHVGIAIEQAGRIHLLHASSTQKKVVISEKPLADYVQGVKHMNGIMVCRLLEP